jgi:hypothetical protein
MLIPYRNSVLTSIFRPFFIGRGRTIICCNINPCATFITQTNDLLKFCALAQKVILVYSINYLLLKILDNYYTK